MKFKATTEKPVTIELDVDGKTAEIRFYPTDLAARQAFFEIYENLKGYKPKDITPTVDENGVSNQELENARELRRFTDYLAEQVDTVFGAGTAEFITGGRCIPTELIRFIFETARYFTEASNRLVKRYLAADESGVME